MLSLSSLVRPRKEVLESTLDESIFAANLGTMLQGTAPPVYGDPAEFFSRTHPSSGLKALLNLCLGRLAGAQPDAPPIIRIDTNLGGGKTHNLIALSHAVQGGLDAGSAERLLSPPVRQTLGSMPGVRLAAFVGTDHGVSASESTMWGLLANQLGGASGYAVVRPDDVGRTAPGTATLAELLGNEPNLIVVDEIAQYLQKADGVEVGNGTLADQTLTFLMALCEAAAQVQRTVLVLTTTQDSSVFSSSTEKVVALMIRVQEITGRQAYLIQPSAEEDLPSILSRRLFEHVDRSNIADIATSYAEALTAAEQRWESGLPSELAPVRLASRMHETWPFHPELIVLLDKRLSTNPYFQRTRGALRLLARTIQLLWQNGAASASAIHPHHLDLADGVIIRPQLTQALQQPQMEAVARADVANENEHEPSRADLIDKRYDASCIRHAATTCFVHSLHLGAAMTQGHTLATTLEPSTDPDILLDGWTRLVREAWYLHQDSEGFRFKTEPSLTKMVVDRTNEVRSSQARSAAQELLENLFASSSSTGNVRRMYLNEKAPDNLAQINICVFGWAQFEGERGVVDYNSPPQVILDHWNQLDSGGQRRYLNHMVFIAPNARYYDRMLRALQRRIALDTLVQDGSITERLSPDVLGDLRDRCNKQQLEARVAVANVMNLCWYPVANDKLELVELTVDSKARAERNQTEVIFEQLRERGKLLTADSPPMDPARLKQMLGQRLSRSITIRGMQEFMASSGSSHMLLDSGQLRAVIQNGIRMEVWDCQRSNGDWVDKLDLDSFSLGEGDSLHLPGTKPEPCPQCGRQPCVCDEPVACPECGEHPCACSKPPPTREFQSTRVPAEAIEDVFAQAQDASATRMEELILEWDAEQDAALRCVAKVLQTLAQVRIHPNIDPSLSVDLETETAGKVFTLKMTCSAPQAQMMEESLKAILRQGEGTACTTRIVFAFPASTSVEGNEKRTIQDAVRGTMVSRSLTVLKTA